MKTNRKDAAIAHFRKRMNEEQAASVATTYTSRQTPDGYIRVWRTK